MADGAAVLRAAIHHNTPGKIPPVNQNYTVLVGQICGLGWCNESDLRGSKAQELKLEQPEFNGSAKRHLGSESVFFATQTLWAP